MSIEKNLERIADALENLVAQGNKGTMLTPDFKYEGPSASVPFGPLDIPAPAPAVPVTAPAVPAPAVPAPVPPAPAPAPASTVPPAPFTDAKGLTAYVMGKYRALGPIKGAQIQNCLSELGYKNINDVQPEYYALFAQKVEAIV